LGKLGNISGRDAVKAFEKAGWLARPSRKPLSADQDRIRANLTVPFHSELAPGTLRALIRVAGLTVDEFLKLL
jgi:predicted RNA binding protein YcfA (HicA-like mRNA interferase family)